MVSLNEIRRAETDLEYWRNESMLWWRMYLRNVMMLKRLRKENRILRALLSDYVKENN